MYINTVMQLGKIDKENALICVNGNWLPLLQT